MAIADHKKAGHALPVGTRCVVRVGVMTVRATVAARCAYVCTSLFLITDGDIIA
jgi:hypothetical protein